MALTVREQIAVTLETLLSGLGATVLRNPQDDFEEGDLPAIGLFLGDESTEEGPTSNISIDRMDVVVAGRAKGATGAEADTAANALYGDALTAIMGDHTLGGLVVNTRKTGLSVSLNANAVGEIPLAGFELSIEIEYWTAATDPTALAP